MTPNLDSLFKRISDRCPELKMVLGGSKSERSITIHVSKGFINMTRSGATIRVVWIKRKRSRVLRKFAIDIEPDSLLSWVEKELPLLLMEDFNE